MKNTENAAQETALVEVQETAIARPVTSLFEATDFPAFCTMTPKTTAEKAMLFKAMTAPTGTIKANVNKAIRIAHIYARGVVFAAEVDEKTGEITKPEEPGVRVAIITPEGESYVASSKGVRSAVSNLLATFGHPDTWDGPITVVPKEIPLKNDRNLLTFDIQL